MLLCFYYRLIHARSLADILDKLQADPSEEEGKAEPDTTWAVARSRQSIDTTTSNVNQSNRNLVSPNQSSPGDRIRRDGELLLHCMTCTIIVLANLVSIAIPSRCNNHCNVQDFRSEVIAACPHEPGETACIVMAPGLVPEA